MSNDLLYLESIAEALERIRCYTQDGSASFRQSTLHQDGVIRNLIVLIHDDLRVNLEQVWETVDRDLPPLRLSIRSIIARESAG
ncbi:DUF86 domain-containing protein [Cyanobium sp. Morenito 9A2]|uniref:HepT-like ribonuclease domain-containing protein n=1 Tax=Cyanobium sp. Morenito 9A2 TaxID=2823718 RepID=UPI0020CCEE8B|nr:DUF86 domain-containing protein [Cyanobium sp. Morenito 9A2]MCP9848511.1 DUF86 domain-containing protein [Cyanobium sp. Morenito 9A2]